MGGLIEYFSTASVHSPLRLDYWNMIASESSAGLSIDSGNRAFDGALDPRACRAFERSAG